MSDEPALKKARVAEAAGSSEGGDVSSGCDALTQKALEEIDSCQNDLDLLTEKASEEILKVEQKFNALRKPYFKRRGEAIKKVQSFWLTSFVNHPQISAILEEEEEECLQFLHAVEVDEHDDIKSGYSIKLHFKPNPYFSNATIVKEFNLAIQGDPVSSSSKIEWKEGKNLVEQSKKRSKGRGALHQSFFSWFQDTSEPATDDIAEVIKDDMWPNPLQYFMGGADDGENGLDGNDESIVTIDDDDDDDEDDEDVEEVEDLDDEDGEGEDFGEGS